MTDKQQAVERLTDHMDQLEDAIGVLQALPKFKDTLVAVDEEAKTLLSLADRIASKVASDYRSASIELEKLVDTPDPLWPVTTEEQWH